MEYSMRLYDETFEQIQSGAKMRECRLRDGSDGRYRSAMSSDFEIPDSQKSVTAGWKAVDLFQLA